MLLPHCPTYFTCEHTVKVNIIEPHFPRSGGRRLARSCCCCFSRKKKQTTLQEEKWRLSSIDPAASEVCTQIKMGKRKGMETRLQSNRSLTTPLSGLTEAETNRRDEMKPQHAPAVNYSTVPYTTWKGRLGLFYILFMGNGF